MRLVQEGEGYSKNSSEAGASQTTVWGPWHYHASMQAILLTLCKFLHQLFEDMIRVYMVQ
jgi:hypothetical protein